MARFTLFAALLAVASAFNGASPLAVRSKLPASRLPMRAAEVSMDASKSQIIGAACVGGFLGVYLFHEVSTGALLAAALAYGATVDNKFGEASKTAGDYASKAYSKTLELNEQYDVLPKVKGAADTVTTAASNLDKNYGFTSKIDEQLKLTEAIDKVGSKFDEAKASVSNKVSDLKNKASAD